jgi:hypothetical protein
MTDEDIQDHQAVFGDYEDHENGLVQRLVGFSEPDIELVFEAASDVGVAFAEFVQHAAVCYARQVRCQRNDR